MNHKDLALRIVEASQLSGTFTLRSGQTTSTYFDKYQFESDPELLTALAQHMGKHIPSDIELLAGLELGGIPIATALSLATGLPAVFVRKQPKKYGTAKLAEGPTIDGRRLLIVEDIVTTAGQVLMSAKDLRERGAIITHAVCAIDREQGGKSALEGIGVQLRSLFVRSELERA